uniref:Polycystin cation channel PKD1/PKD2 domain-containing protein n=1 Tax=Haptolina brevifila TaxID=156173 RepID=A0A7S2IP49_9EUKA|mmetsp:Transcript_69273/g.137360  ORF Transcript_69273/g.137360 Transcript_69273/m.137360 type:complete len:873 (+) Transcript_69273:114-2732(+)
MNAIRRETKEVERSLKDADAQYADVSEELRKITQERLNTEEELMASNVRLKQLLGELQAQKEQAVLHQSDVPQQGSRMTMGELTRKVETVLMNVLDERFRDEAFTSAITEQSSLSSANKVRVEFENDEVFWALQDNYSFEMLLQDAARYWDVASQDVILVDERGAIWPNDAYVQLEIQRNPTHKIALKIKPVAVAVEEDIELYGREGEEESDDDDEDMDQSVLAIALAAEDELLKAQATGVTASLNTKQKLALRRKLKYELYAFIAFVVFFVWSMYGRRTVRDAFRLQDAVATAFTEENFGDYNEKTYLDIANAEEMFDWMGGPLQDGLFPDTLYNDQPIPSSRQGYVMTYNRIVGKIRLRQLRVAPDLACTLSDAIEQYDTTSDGSRRHRQFVDHCYGAYSMKTLSNASFGPAHLANTAGTGFKFSTAEENDLAGLSISGKVATYDGSGFVRDLDAVNRSAYIEALELLKDNLWVDELTRAVIVSLNLYNGNYNYYCISQFLLEFSQGGTLIPTANNRILRIDLYEMDSLNNVGKILTLYVPEILTALGTLAYLLQFFFRVYRVKKVTRYFRNVFRDRWVFVDLVLFTALITTYVLRWSYYFSRNRTDFSPFNEIKGGRYFEMTKLAEEYSTAFIIDAFTVLVLVIKSLKFFQLQKDLMLLQKTLGQAIQDLAVFLVMLTVLFGGFVIMGNNIFGMQAPGFKSILDTLGTLFLILLGEFDFDEMQEVSPFWSLVFFVFFVIFMFFIVLNIFLAILNDAYTVVRANTVWDELERRKPLSLQEKFEVRKAEWRERKNINRMKKVKKEKIKSARKAKKEIESRGATRELFDPIRRKNRRKASQDSKAGDADGATSSTRADGQPQRKTHVKDHPF